MTNRLFVLPIIILSSLASCNQVQQPDNDTIVIENRPISLQSNNITLPAIDPKGVNIRMLDQEITTLRNAAIDIEGDVQTMLSRLNQLEMDIEGYELIRKTITNSETVNLDRILETQSSEETSELIIEPSPSQTLMAEQAPASGNTETADKNNGVTKVRYGIHNDKTRIALDIKGSTANIVSFDREAGVVTVTLPKTGWVAPYSETYNLAQLEGYQAKESEGGTIIALGIQKTSSVQSFALTNPNRIIIDLIK